MTIPDYQSLMLPVLQVAADGVTRVPDAADKIANQLGLTEEEREELLPSGKQRLLHNRVHWAKFYLSKAGLIDSPKRGWFVTSSTGKELLATHPASVTNETLMKYSSFKDFLLGSAPKTKGDELTPSGPPTLPPSGSTPEEQIEAAVTSLSSALKGDLIERVLANSPAFFENLIVELLVAMGYGGSHRDAAKQLGRAGDGGVDGVVNEDRLGLDRVYIQAKRYNGGTVGRPEVQAFVGSLVGLGASKGVFVTTSSFSPHAKDYAKSLSQRVVLIDGKQLADLMVEHDVGVRIERRLDIKRIDEDFFLEED